MILLMAYFGLINRIRGGLAPVWYADFTKLLPRNFYYFILFTLGMYAYGLDIIPSSMIAFGFWVGSLDGWGKWIGEITNPDGYTQHEKEGLFGAAQWIGQKLSPQNYYRECLISLTIRGIQWAILPAIGFIYMGSSIIESVVFIIALGVGMPVSYVLATKWFKSGWESGEVIYGAMQGLGIYLMILGGK